jgi:hypothetical protein
LKSSICSIAVWTLTVLVIVAPVSARAQTPPMPPTDLFLGYQTLHIPGQNYPLGIAVGVTHGLTEMIRIVGEVGVSIDQQSASNLNGTLTLYHYGIGPRVIASSGRVLPFAQVLVGGVHTRADLTSPAGAPFTASGNAFMIEPGAGVIVPLSRTFGLIGAFNYRRVFFKDAGDNETSVFVGVRIAFR